MARIESARLAGARLSPTDRKVQILAAARGLLERRPIDALSVESVAEEAGVSPGLLFHYFGSQRKLRQAVLRAVADELLDHVRPDPALSLGEQLRSGIEAFVDQVSRHPSVYLAVVRLTSTSGNPETRALHRAIRATFTVWITDGLTGAGLPPTPAVDLALHGWQAFVEEVVAAWLDQPAGDRMPRADLVDLCERGCYQLVMLAVDDPGHWERIVPLLGRRA
ncbi:TetR/AcrR family transcriptional regulator [Streptacidiphilus sp. EB129]|uniref:TetR/AcrR family transcriptional regulator n=1 Tax=Streptacidiphilus sp. EB129 TaxID=3156262 RepID=UPI003510D988